MARRWFWALLGGMLALPVLAGESDEPGRTRLLYLPVYSHVWYGDRDKGGPYKAMMSALVSIRSTDPGKSLRVKSARYYSTEGKLLAEYLTKPRPLPPLGTIELLVERREDKGGSGANFLIEWEADGPVSPPLVQAVHVSVQAQRGLSFVTEAREVSPGR